MHLRFNQFGFHSALPFVLFVYGMGCQSAQAQQPVKAPVEVKARPSTALPNSIITISGKSLALGKNNQVTIKVSPPSGTSPDIKATMDATGNYSISYKAGTMGKYRVLVTGADGKGSAEAAFTVDSPGTEADEDSAATHKLISATIKAEDIVDQQIPALPPSPAKDELEKKSAALKKSLAQVPAVQKQFEDALAKISDIESKDPEFLSALQPLYDELNADKEAIQTKEEQINRAIDEAKTNNATCDSLELFNQIFTLISESLDMIGKPWQKLLNVAMDKGTSKAIDAIAAKSTSEETKLKAGELAKVSVGFLSAGAEAANPMTLITVGIGLAAEAAQYCVQKVFAKYCEKFEGPVYAQFRAEMRHNGAPWFTYKVTLRGKLQLRYTKDDTIKPGQPIPLTGQIEGMAETFEMAENAILLAPQLRNRVMRHAVFPIAGLPYIESMSTFARMALPQSFYIPVRGALLGDKITLSIKDAVKDFPDIMEGKILYIFVEPALPIPHIQSFKHPIQKAYFIFTRGMTGSPQFDVKTDSAKSSIEHTFTRTVEDKTADFKVDWKIDVRACDPGCLP